MTLPVAAPAHVWVDARWTGAHHCGGHNWQVDAFRRIQDAVNAVADGGSVTVAAGVYVEKVTIGKPLSLLGPGAGISPNAPGGDPFAANPARGNPGAEAVILPPSTRLTLPEGFLVEVAASHVTVDGFTLDGSNPRLPDGVLLNEVKANAAAGIGFDKVNDDGEAVLNNLLRNFSLDGVHFFGKDAASMRNRITGNRIDNLPQGPDSLPYLTTGVLTSSGIRVGNDFYGEISDNTITRAAVGIHYSNGYIMGASPVIAENRVSAYRTGICTNIFLDHVYVGPVVLVARNTISMLPSASATSPDRFGICCLTTLNSAQTLLLGNDITGGEAGIFLYMAPSVNPPAVQISGGTIRAAKYGIWATNYCPFGPAPVDCSVLVRGVTIRQATAAGIYVEDDARGKKAVLLTLSNAVRIFDGPTAILLRGGRAAVQCQPGFALHVNGQQGHYLTLQGNGETAPQPIDVSAVRFGGGEDYHQAKQMSAMSAEERKALSDKLEEWVGVPGPARADK